MTSRVIRASLPILQLISSLPPSKTKLCRALVSSGDKDLSLAICECVKNSLYNPNIKLTSTQKKKLQQYKRQLIKLSDRRTSESDRLKILRKFGHLFTPTVVKICYRLFSEVNDEYSKTVQTGSGGHVQTINEQSATTNRL